MSGENQGTTIGELPTPESDGSYVPAASTAAVWTLWLASVGALGLRLGRGEGFGQFGPMAVDGLTVVMWATVTFFSGVVHSYSRRYMAGNRSIDRFFGLTFAFTLVVTVLVAADHLALFVTAWLAMGLVMAELIRHLRDWSQARAAAAIARRYFLASTAGVAVAVGTLWWQTGATTFRDLPSAVEAAPTTVVLFVAGVLFLAAMVQSALLPFHTWLLSSMTAPTPASALMHAGFVNAGGILLVRFAPVVTRVEAFMLAVATLGAASALGGKLLKTVQTDVKGELGCSTVGQMGFMILQAGLGFFGAAMTHLILHGFYKAYQFLAAGSRVAHESPRTEATSRETTVPGVVVMAASAVLGGVLFAALTGKGTTVDSGLLLTMLVVLTVLHAARELVSEASLPATVRYGAVPLVTLPAVVTYAAVFTVVESLLAGLPGVGMPAELSPVHGVLAVAFVLAYLVVETGAYERSTRLYVWLLNATQPAPETQLTATGEYDEN